MQVEESRHESLVLQSRVSELTMQLGTRDQEMLRLEGFMKAHERRAAAYTPRRMLSCPDVRIRNLPSSCRRRDTPAPHLY